MDGTKSRSWQGPLLFPTTFGQNTSFNHEETSTLTSCWIKCLLLHTTWPFVLEMAGSQHSFVELVGMDWYHKKGSLSSMMASIFDERGRTYLPWFVSFFQVGSCVESTWNVPQTFQPTWLSFLAGAAGPTRWYIPFPGATSVVPIFAHCTCIHQ